MAYAVYVSQTWVDGSASTPVSAARLGANETGTLNSFYSPAARVFHNTTQSIPSSGTVTALAFNSERYDQAGNAADTQHDTAVNNSRLTCRYAGIYSIKGNVQWATSPSSASGVILQLRLNGTTQIGNVDFISSDSRIMQVCTDYQLAVNDYVELCCSQQTGSAINITSAGNYTPEFMWHRVG